MHAKTMTALVLASAGAVAAGALILDHTRAEGHATRSEPEPVACGSPAPAKADTKLEHGTLAAKLAAGKIARGQGGDVQVGFDLATDRIDDAQRPPLDLAFVIDHSGSMDGGRLDHAKSAAHGIVERLGPQDHVALIQYDDSAEVVIASIPTDAAGKKKLNDAIDHLQLGGGTNLHDGLVLGRNEVQRAYTTGQGQVERVILLSDGRANVGIVATPQIAEVARDAANHGVRITSVGIGLDFNEDLMEAIAEAGRGNYHYVKEAHDLDAVIAGELQGVQATVATNVELRLRAICPAASITAVHGYESKQDGGDVVVPMADLFGGDHRKLLVSLKVPDKVAGQVAALHAELVYRDGKGAELKRRALDLGVEVTDDNAAAIASVDQDVMSQVLQLQAAESMRQAAQAYERGDTAAATQILDTTTREIDRKAIRYKVAKAKSAAALDSLDEMKKQATAYSPTSDEGKGMIKATKQKARVMSKKGM